MIVMFHEIQYKSHLIILGERWRRKRKLFTPSFHFEILNRFIEIFYKNGKILLDKFTEEVGKPGFIANNYVMRCTLDIISGKFSVYFLYLVFLPIFLICTLFCSRKCFI